MDFFESVADKIAAGTERGRQLGRQVREQAAAAGRVVRDGAAEVGRQASAAGRAVRDGATEAARQAAAAGRAVRDGAVEMAGAARDRAVEVGRAARDRAEQAARTVADTARAGAEWTQQRAGEAAEWATQRGRQAAQAASDAVDWTQQRAGEVIDWGAEKGQQALQAVQDGGSWARRKAEEAANWLNQKGQQLTNQLVNGVASGIGSIATRFPLLERCLEQLRDNNRVLQPEDGQFMGNDCPKTSATPPTTGRLPQGCTGQSGLPKIIYTNGINTPPAAACATMRTIANQRCAEVIGVYNATYGTVQDTLDSKDNIDRAGREPSSHSQARLLSQMLSENPPQRVTIYAHSQGGLITQEGLGEAAVSMRESTTRTLIQRGMNPLEAEQEANRQTTARMGNVDVYSFGTAEREWPSVGARYHQFTNRADPVPQLIDAVQANRGVPREPDNLVERRSFETNSWNPLVTHSMDETYMAELNRVHPVPKKANGQCC